MSANLVDYFVPLLGEAGGWKGSEVKGWEFPGSLFQHASHCHCWYVYPLPPSSPNAGSHTFKFNRFILLLTTPQATPTQDQMTNNVAVHLPLESKQIDLRELQHVINDDLPLPLSHGNPLPQMWPLLIFCSVSIYSLMAGNAGGLYNHNCRVNEAQMLVPRMQIFFSFQVREGY